MPDMILAAGSFCRKAPGPFTVFNMSEILLRETRVEVAALLSPDQESLGHWHLQRSCAWPSFLSAHPAEMPWRGGWSVSL